MATPWKQAALRASAPVAPGATPGRASATAPLGAAPLKLAPPPPSCRACGTPLPSSSCASDQCDVCGFVNTAAVVVGPTRRPVEPVAPPAPLSAWPRAAVQPAGALFFAGQLPPLGAAVAAVGATSSAACLACSPARRCAAHTPRAAPAAPPKKTSRVPAPPRGAPLQKEPKKAPLSDGSNRLRPESSYNYDARVDPACRLQVLAAAARAAAGDGACAAPSAELQRALMGGAKARVALRLDTKWSVEANCPRSRVRCMLAAGWTPVEGSFGGHPRWQRTLEAGPLAGRRQVINFSGTYSTFCWDLQSADLLRMDRIACGER